VRGSFAAAHAAITHRCGPVLGKRQIEQAVVNAAADIGAFYAARIPEPCTASTVLVISAGAKGIVMRPEALRSATAARQGNWGGTRLLRTTPMSVTSGGLAHDPFARPRVGSSCPS
jgi:hypothetical protein